MNNKSTDMEIPTGFKMTELVPLQEEWKVIRLGEIVSVVNGYAFKSDDYVPQGILNFRVVNIRDGGIIDIKTDAKYLPFNYAEQYSKYMLNEEDILLVMVGATRGKLAYIHKSILPALMNQNMWRVVPFNDELSKGFLYLYLRYRIEDFLSNYSENSRGFFKKDEFRAVFIPLPPLPEQKKIAAVLSAVQEAKEKTETVIKATRELKKSLMKHLFTYGPVLVDEAENVPLKETEIGLVPEEWEVVRLGDIVRKTEQKDPRKTPEWKFKYIDVSSISRETLKIEDYKLYEGENAPSRAKKIVRQGDVIFATVRPTLKRLALIDETFDGEICSTAFCVLRANGNLAIPLYLFYAVGRHTVIDGLGKIQRGASYPAVTDSDVKNQKISLPPLPTQQKIADILSTVDKKIEAEENKKKALEELFKTLLHQLMTGKIRLNYQLKNDKINRGGSYYD